MTTADYDKFIADRQRRSIRAVMNRKGLALQPWCKAVGIAEGGVRNFLSGLTGSITAVNAQKLADHAGVPISELLWGEKKRITSIAGYIINNATISRAASEPTPEEEHMLNGAEHSANAEIFRIRTTPPSLDDGSLILFDNKIHEDFDRYIGKRIVVKLAGGGEVVKILYRGSIAGRYNLQSYGLTGDNAPLAENVEIEWCALLRQIILPV